MQHRLHLRPARSYTPPSSLNRVVYAVLAIAVVATGLLWRSCFIPLPPDLSNYGGDALWALMVFVGFGFLFPRASTLTLALLALTFSWGVEFSQLYQAPWIDAVRATLPGGCDGRESPHEFRDQTVCDEVFRHHRRHRYSFVGLAVLESDHGLRIRVESRFRMVWLVHILMT